MDARAGTRVAPLTSPRRAPAAWARRSINRLQSTPRWRRRHAASRDRRHHDLDLRRIRIHCSAGSVNAEADDSAEDEVSGGHALHVGRDDPGAVLVAFLLASDGNGIATLWQADRCG